MTKASLSPRSLGRVEVSLQRAPDSQHHDGMSPLTFWRTFPACLPGGDTVHRQVLCPELTQPLVSYAMCEGPLGAS